MESFRLLTEPGQLDELLEASGKRPVLLFKHSTACPVSAAAHDELRRFLESGAAGQAEVAVVKVIEHRPVSNEIQRRLNVKHESPQAILVKEGRAVWHASHWNVTEDGLREALQAHGEV